MCKTMPNRLFRKKSNDYQIFLELGPFGTLCHHGAVAMLKVKLCKLGPDLWWNQDEELM